MIGNLITIVILGRIVALLAWLTWRVEIETRAFEMGRHRGRRIAYAAVRAGDARNRQRFF